MLATDFTPAGIVIGILGAISLLAAAVFVVLGARARTLNQQQDQAIGALEGRVTALESENRELRATVQTTNVLVEKRDAEIGAAEARIKGLERIVTQADEIAEFRDQVAKDHEKILDAITRQSS